ncbi:peptidase inhibitor family I36 protein [Methylobacterium sp. J-076]|uniref:peptidase inhibitor family I36 protein n=1 Tax=Methylobacterium sp. J-076 TaxID=2836655 RepID=UPI001FBBC6CF|nr:peptidase inhibitor family I36 protein [Methylobacterium sp. J-076]MCJ2014260.1 peptidase inhibitor family I36 protein [Methylobacterium sp. J-076]
MEAVIDPGEWRGGLPATTFPPPSHEEAGRNALVALPPAPAEPSDGGARSRYVIPAVLIAGWGGLFAYCAAYLREDLPFRPQPASETARRTEEPPRRVVLLPDPPAEPPRAVAPPAPAEADKLAAAAPAPAAASPVALVPPRRVAPAPAPVDYVGIWGPTPAACRTPSRRRGYLPATITADRARAGRTTCAFHDGHHTGNTWLMAAECTDRGRRWSSQVRLVVDGDRLTWASSRGAATYVRCGRRAG